MENTVNWPEEVYNFTKVQGSVKTWVLNKKLPITESTAVYSNNYGESLVFTKEVISLYYYTSLENCYDAWIDSIEKFKEKVIKQFENKCGINYYEYSNAKFKAWLDGQPEFKERMQKVKDEMDKSE